MRFLFLFLVFIPCSFVHSQVILEADGPGDTYELISSVLAPNYDPVEEPDCNHTAFGRHIDEVFDVDLNDFVFRFHIHTDPDNDRCINFDRQRNEIKAYDKSPDNLLGTTNETVVYKWKFKLDADFQSSSSFTHIHQLKAVGGSESSMPLITLTTRKGNPDRLELRYAETTSQITLKQMDLAPLKGIWLEATETVLYGEIDIGEYSLSIKKVSDDTELFSYHDSAIRLWKTDASFIRPKWGIYRSLNDATSLRDEVVLFADFSVEEIGTTHTDQSTIIEQQKILLYPNPTRNFINIQGEKTILDGLKIYNLLGNEVSNLVTFVKLDANHFSVDLSLLPTGLYNLRTSRTTHKIYKQ